MPLRYDAAAKTLVEEYPLDWLHALGVEVEGEVELVDTDLSTVSADADKLIRIQLPIPMLVDLELQSSRDEDLPYRLLLYTAVALRRDRLPLEGLVVLLRREADYPGLTGELSAITPGGSGVLFRYRVVKVWEQASAWALESGPGMLPLAPLTRITANEIPGIIRRMAQRMEELSVPARDTLWATTYILMGLRYPEAVAQLVQRETRSMKESVTYQAILREGREEEARRLIRQLGEKRFGALTSAVEQTINSLPLLRLEELSLRLLDVESWDELLAE